MDLSGWLSGFRTIVETGSAGLSTELISLTAALSAASLGLAWFFWQSRVPARDDDLQIEASDGCVFLFQGVLLRASSDSASALLGSLPDPQGEDLPRLTGWLSQQCRALGPEIAALFEQGRPFCRDFPTGDGRCLELRGEPRGALTALILRDSTLARQAQMLAEARAEALQRDRDTLRELADRIPALMWRRQNARILWANPAYQAQTGGGPGRDTPPDYLFSGPSEALPTPEGEGQRRRMSLHGRGGERNWFDVSEFPGSGDETLGFALSADGTVRAEAALKRFVETLTETFAHLPIGLAIFDKNRRLGLFNPSISDILKLDPSWLATRPTLRDFLERLRENRQMPDQRDFLAWRRKLTALERDAEEAAYEEDWVLPSGQTLRVIGRPHPQGAIAFLFEDISASVTLERRYRSEIEMYGAVLNKLPEAVALFAPDGTLAHANTAFRGVWGFEPDRGPLRSHVAQMIEIWSALAAPSAVWRDLKDFATGQEARSAWTARIGLLDGRVLRTRVAPLPDGSTLVSFNDETERERAQACLRDRVAVLEAEADQREARNVRLAEEVEATLQDVARLARSAAREDQPLAERLAGAVATLRRQMAELGDAPDPADRPETDPKDVERALRSALDLAEEVATRRSIGLHRSLDSPDLRLAIPPRRFRKLVSNLLADALAACPDGGRLDVSGSVRNGRFYLCAATPETPPDAQTGVSGHLLRRIAGTAGGIVTVEEEVISGRRLLICSLPLAPQASPPKSLAAPNSAATG